MTCEIAARALDRPRSRSPISLGFPQAAGAGCDHFRDVSNMVWGAERIALTSTLRTGD
jgi:hypothetical protein